MKDIVIIELFKYWFRTSFSGPSPEYIVLFLVISFLATGIYSSMNILPILLVMLMIVCYFYIRCTSIDDLFMVYLYDKYDISFRSYGLFSISFKKYWNMKSTLIKIEGLPAFKEFQENFIENFTETPPKCSFALFHLEGQTFYVLLFYKDEDDVLPIKLSI